MKLITVVSALMLIMSPYARADETCQGETMIGQSGDFGPDAETGAQFVKDLAFPTAGVIKGFKFHANKKEGPVYIGVYNSWSGMVDQLAMVEVPVAQEGMNEFMLPEDQQIHVKAGDYLGVHYAAGVQGVIAKKAGEGMILVNDDLKHEDWPPVFFMDVDEDDFRQEKGMLALQAVVCPEQLGTTPAPPVVVKTPAPTEAGPQCYFPFHYYGKDYNTCVKINSDRYWCSTDPKYGGGFKFCDSNDRLPENMPCHFPFTYLDRTFHSCFSQNNEQAWCSVGPVFNGQNWRYCKRTDKLAELEPCHLPFTYKGQTYNKCSVIGDAKKPWCALTTPYSASSWRYCREVTVEAIPIAGQKVSSAGEADDTCWVSDMTLATESDARAGWDLGNESCECAWTTEGKRFRLVQQGGQCGDAEAGVHECDDAEAVPLCTKDTDSFFA